MHAGVTEHGAGLNARPTKTVTATAGGQLPSRPTTLTGLKFLAETYTGILDASFDAAERRLRDDCVTAPAEACRTLDVVRRWWQIQLDPASTTHDDAFSAAAAAAIAAAEAWTVREPASAEAWFYLGGTYAARVQWRALRRENLAAARDGKRIKQALERAVALAPDLDDAYFGIGMYQYYADVAPTAAKIIRWLLLLPGGDRQAGLARMLRARGGQLLRGEATFQLQLIYLWYERDHERSLELLEDLRNDHRQNPIFWRLIADVQDRYAHDVPASLATYEALLDAADRGRVNEAALARTDARLGLARQLDVLHETDRAIPLLDAIVREAPVRPHGAIARAQLQLGAAFARMGDRARAEAAYRAAMAAAPPDDPYGVRDLARRARRPPGPAGEAYRLSLQGWREFERKHITIAAEALSRAAALAPDDPVIAYRFGRVLEAQNHSAAALTQYEHAIEYGALAPPPLLSAIYLHAGGLVQRDGRTPRAIEMYERAAHLFGAGADARRLARLALTRVP